MLVPFFIIGFGMAKKIIEVSNDLARKWKDAPEYIGRRFGADILREVNFTGAARFLVLA